MNTPVQGGASEIMLAAAWYITESLLKTKLDGHLVNIVHDESITETHDDCIIDVAKIIKKSKEKALLTVFPEATILNLVEVGCGTSWLEAKGKDGIIQLK